MKRVNRIKWPQMKMAWELKKMASAYILAERQIIDDASRGIDTTGHIAETQGYTFYTSSTSPEEHFAKEVDIFGNLKPFDEKESILEKARNVRKKLDEAIANDEFEKAEIYQITLDALQRKYDKL